jgi:hypothetical protein
MPRAKGGMNGSATPLVVGALPFFIIRLRNIISTIRKPLENGIPHGRCANL